MGLSSIRPESAALIVVAILVCFITACGCVTINLNTPPMVNSSAAIPSVNESPPVPASGDGPAETETVVTVATPEVTTAIADPFSKSDVHKRFQEVVFGNEAQYLNRWENRYVKLGIAGDYTEDDVRTLEEFVLRFNNESATTKLTMPYESETQELSIHFVPPSFFLTVDENKANKVARNTRTGEVIFVDYTDTNSWVERDIVYINSRFSGDERKFQLLRAFLYNLGFEGFTDDTDSIFFYAGNNSHMSEMDWTVINLLYSKKFDYRESLSSVKSKLN